MENLTEILRNQNINSPNLYIKRDDLTGLALGGNKTRKLEYILHEALQNKATNIIVKGYSQSNLCRLVAAACRKLNLDCHLFLIEGHSEEKTSNRLYGNLLLDKLFGAEIFFDVNESKANEKIDSLVLDLKKEGKIPYIIPEGGTNEIGLLGYLEAFHEILEEEKKLKIKFDRIVFASSSLGTQCGLILGNKIFKGENQEGKSKIIHGISVRREMSESENDSKNQIEKMTQMLKQFSNNFRLELNFTSEDILFDQRFVKSGYHFLSEDDKKGIDVFAKTEGIVLDPIYTSRAAGGLLKMIEDNEFKKEENILFIHTGGIPTLFTEYYK